MIDISPAPESPWTQEWSNTYSQFGEDGVIESIFRKIGTTNKQCFEVGAADGKWFSNTRALIDKDWRACLIEADESNWPELDKLDSDRVTVVHGKAEASGPHSLDSILTMAKFDQYPDLGVIDVDGQDWYLWNGMLRFHPRVIVIEYDRFAPEGFVPDKDGQGQAGLAAMLSIGVSKGYFNVAATPTNLIFVSNKEREKFLMAQAEEETGQTLVPAEVKNAIERLAKPDAPAPEPATPAAPVLATGKEQEIKVAAILSRPRFGLNVFWDCAGEALAPWHIPIRSFYGVFFEQMFQKGLEDCLLEGIDWALCLDYDTLFTSQHVQMLIDAIAQNPEIDAIAALQCRRGRPLPLAVRSDGAMPMTGGPVKVRTAHFGLTLIRVEKLRKMRKPWLWSTPAPDGSWGEGRLDADIYFWGQWGDSGNSLYVHTGCRIGHVEEMVSEFDENGKVSHAYISEWRKRHGHQIKTFE